MNSYLSIVKQFRSTIFRIFIISLIMTMLIGIIFFIPIYERDIKNNLYSNIDLPDFVDIIEPTEQSINSKSNPILLRNDNSWNNRLTEILNMGIKINNSYSMAPYIHFAVNVFPLFKDANKTYESNQYFLNGSIREKPTIFLTLTSEDNYNKIQKAYYSGETDLIFISNLLNPRYLNDNETLTVIGESNQSLSIDNNVFFQYPNPDLLIQKKSLEKFPYLPISLKSPFIISTVEKFFSIFKDPIKISSMHIEIQSKYRLTQTIDTDKLFQEEYIRTTHSILKKYLELETSKIMSNDNNYRNTAFTIVREESYTTLKNDIVKKSLPGFSIILAITWISSLLISTGLFLKIIDQISYKSNFGNLLGFLDEIGFKSDIIFNLKLYFIGGPIILGNLIGLFLLQIYAILVIHTFIKNAYFMILTTIFPLFLYFSSQVYVKYKNTINQFIFSNFTSIKSKYTIYEVNPRFFLLFLLILVISLLISVENNAIFYFMKEFLAFIHASPDLYFLLTVFITPLVILLLSMKYLFLFINSFLSLFTKLYTKILVKDEFYYLTTSLRRHLFSQKNNYRNIFLLIVVIMVSFNFMSIQKDRLYFESELEVGSDILIKSQFIDMQDISIKLNEIKKKLEGESYKISPYLWTFSNLRYSTNVHSDLSNESYTYIDATGISMLMIDFKYIDKLFSNPLTRLKNTSTSVKKGDLTSILSTNIVNVIGPNSNKFNISFFNSQTLYENQTYQNVSLLGEINFAPRLISHPLGAFASSVFDIYQIMPLIWNKSIQIEETVEMGFFLWLEDPQDYHNIMNKLSEYKQVLEVSPFFTNILSSEKQIQLNIYNSFFIPLIFILIVLLSMLIVIDIVETNDKSSQIISSFILNDFDKRKVFYSFYLYFASNYFVVLIFSLLIGISLSITALYVLIEMMNSIYKLSFLRLNYLPFTTLIFILISLFYITGLIFAVIKKFSFKYESFDEFVERTDKF